MTALPEWVSRCENTICEDDYEHLWQALAIAWEALELLKTVCSNHDGIPLNAMRRITELGKD